MVMKAILSILCLFFIQYRCVVVGKSYQLSDVLSDLICRAWSRYFNFLWKRFFGRISYLKVAHQYQQLGRCLDQENKLQEQRPSLYRLFLIQFSLACHLFFFAPYRDNSKSILPSQDYLVCLGGSKANGHVMFLRRHFAKFSLWFFRVSS